MEIPPRAVSTVSTRIKAIRIFACICSGLVGRPPAPAGALEHTSASASPSASSYERGLAFAEVSSMIALRASAALSMLYRDHDRDSFAALASMTNAAESTASGPPFTAEASRSNSCAALTVPSSSPSDDPTPSGSTHGAPTPERTPPGGPGAGARRGTSSRSLPSAPDRPPPRA